MKHLSRPEFVDFIESSPTLPLDRVRHVEACEACRAEAETLRAVMAVAQTDEAAEPSPLFWDHFAARVADAVLNEAPAARPPGGMRWLRAPLATWAAASTVAVLVIMTVVWRTTLHAPPPTGLAQASAAPPRVTSPSTPVAPGGDDVDADEAWAVVRAAAVDLRWEDAHAAGISAHPGAVEDIALELTADERSELARLLEQDLKHTGV
jgi:hypothetical protein